MHVELTPTLIDMYRETFEGQVRPGWCWIVSGPAADSVFGTLAALSADQAYAVPGPQRKSIAAHVAHLKFTLHLTFQRLHGENPPVDWPGSFAVVEAGSAAWEQLQQELRTAYEAVLAYFEDHRHEPLTAWIPIHAVGLVAMIGHNAYHLGAIRQLAAEVRGK